jgi:hypothetical protein
VRSPAADCSNSAGHSRTTCTPIAENTPPSSSATATMLPAAASIGGHPQRSGNRRIGVSSAVSSTATATGTATAEK